ncbi:uncharacterized protein LOC113471199 [Diaphorina citri]|jgi:hypothetical protein|uniref:Uncharacterized protein LOC113471199 n=1 Tax=Diaphorina citri TaxID=121845 RepID=A0A3Q0JBR8_DIACI|nr:uncharacterized protein LOC113471199 [Diaphorina citri]
MSLIIRYFSHRENKVVTTFYRLLEIEAGDHLTMVTAFQSALEKDGLKIDKLLGIGIDGANVMTGKYNSFSSKLKELIPHLVIVKCVCHSLHLAAEKSLLELPSHIDFLIKECTSWFSKSTDRQVKYRKLFEAM